ncbi:hypothetical protein C8A05DRAFT_38722 [Staphylotrichum tortipilum]|uniref:Uncharacterized protein n=1 Tax=Staphylotrichum tortipilum TaxID=2831512 RepID=A0AAN6MB72_9PEZI|nr:hypothetical protein C8A05DRAFT_38722 [Staphylotrichum longicolle]
MTPTKKGGAAQLLPNDNDGGLLNGVDEQTVDIVLGRTCKLYSPDPDCAAVQEPNFAYAPSSMKKTLRFHELWAVTWVLSSKLHGPARGLETHPVLAALVHPAPLVELAAEYTKFAKPSAVAAMLSPLVLHRRKGETFALRSVD